MNRNMGALDRIIRFFAGVLLLGLYGAVDPPWRYFTLLGLVLVATALSGRCPLYQVFGLSTLRRPEPRG
jgi:hypothetical protein